MKSEVEDPEEKDSAEKEVEQRFYDYHVTAVLVEQSEVMAKFFKKTYFVGADQGRFAERKRLFELLLPRDPETSCKHCQLVREFFAQHFEWDDYE